MEEEKEEKEEEEEEEGGMFDSTKGKGLEVAMEGSGQV